MVLVVLLNWTMIWKCQNCLFVFAFIRLFRSSATYHSINQTAQWHTPIFSEIESLDPKRSSLLSLFILLVSMQTRVSLSGTVCSLFTLLDWLAVSFLAGCIVIIRPEGASGRHPVRCCVSWRADARGAHHPHASPHYHGSQRWCHLRRFKQHVLFLFGIYFGIIKCPSLSLSTAGHTKQNRES